MVEGWAGSLACAECHEAEFSHWRRTPHARAMAEAGPAANTAGASCRRCHASLVVSPESEADRLQLDLQAVGCESCHGPGLAHAQDPESVSGTITGVRDHCPDCNFRGLCQVCHNSDGDPDFRYFEAYRRVRHPGPGDVPEEELIPLEGTGGPACSRQMNR